MTGGGSPREILEDVQFADWSPDGQSLAVVRDLRRQGPPRVPDRQGPLRDGRLDQLTRASRRAATGRVPGSSRSGRRRGFGGDRGPLGKAPSALEVLRQRAGALLVAGRQGSLVHRRGRRLQPRALRRDAIRRRACAGPGDRRSHRRGLLEGRPSADGPGQGAAGDLRTGSGSGEGAGLSWLDWSLVRDLSADGQTLLFGESGEGGGPGYSAYVRKADGSPAVRLGPGNALRLSSDGRLARGHRRGSHGPAARPVSHRSGGAEDLSRRTGLRFDLATFLPDGPRSCSPAAEPGRGVRL